jgi:hypothetical protein
MIENKDLPNEFVSIRQVWILQINRCTEAISNRYKTDISVRGGYADVSDVGVATVIESVISLYHILVDYGEATIKSEVKQILDEFQAKEDYNENKLYYYRKIFEFIIQTLNKYGMLFDSTPKGYSNTVMKSL